MKILEILEKLAQFGKVLRAGKGWLAHCPSHNDRKPSLSVRVSGGRILIHCFAGCSTERILEALGMQWGDLFEEGEEARAHTWVYGWRGKEEEEGEIDTKRREELEKIWLESLPLESSSLALTYLEKRGIKEAMPIPGLRFHPHLAYREEGKKEYFPALLAKVHHPRLGLVALHRTYLGSDGEKARVSFPKKLTPSLLPGGTKGAWITLISGLTHDRGFLVGEGIENALSFYLLHRERFGGFSVISSISSHHMERMLLEPPYSLPVVIAADHDGKGYGAALSLAGKLLAQGVKVEIHLPPLGMDWNDVVRTGMKW